MCFMSTPEAPPPPPPPPAAPPVLDQSTPKLSEANDQGNYLDKRAQGFKAYKIDRRNTLMDRSNRIGGIGDGGSNKSNY